MRISAVPTTKISVADYIPFVSTARSLYFLFKQCVSPKSAQGNSLQERSFSYFPGGKTGRLVALLIPVFGNILVALYDLTHRFSVTRRFPPKNDISGADKPKETDKPKEPEAKVKQFEELEKNYNAGQKDKTCALGLCYLNGDGVQKDDTKALKLFNEAINQGDPNGAYQLGACYAEGKAGCPVSKKDAILYFREAGNGGSAEGYFRAAMIAMGNQPTKDEMANAKSDLRSASDLGHLDAMCALYEMEFFDTMRQSESLPQARYRDWCQTAAKKGNVNASYYYSYDQLISYEESVKKCTNKNSEGKENVDNVRLAKYKPFLDDAVKYLTLAAGKNHPRALFMLAQLQDNYLEKDEKNFLSLMRQAATLGLNDAIEMLKTRTCEIIIPTVPVFHMVDRIYAGETLSTSNKETKPAQQENPPQSSAGAAPAEPQAPEPAQAAPAKSFKELDAEYKAGQKESIGLLGLCYLNGDGVSADQKKAIELFKEGVDEQDIDCSYQLALCNETGYPGLDKNLAKAMELYENVHLFGSVETSPYYADAFYRSGRLTLHKEPNSREGMGYLYEAAKLGHCDAMCAFLERKVLKDEAAGHEVRVVMESLEKLANQKDARAAYLVGRKDLMQCQREEHAGGKPDETDLQNANMYLSIAADKNHPIALYLLACLSKKAPQLCKHDSKDLCRRAAELGVQEAIEAMKSQYNEVIEPIVTPFKSDSLMYS